MSKPNFTPEENDELLENSKELFHLSAVFLIFFAVILTPALLLESIVLTVVSIILVVASVVLLFLADKKRNLYLRNCKELKRWYLGYK